MRNKQSKRWFGFAFVGEFQIHRWSEKCWFERSQWSDVFIPWIYLKNSAWYSPIIFWLRGMNSYDACYWDIFTTEKHLQITTMNLVAWPCDQNYFSNVCPLYLLERFFGILVGWSTENSLDEKKRCKEQEHPWSKIIFVNKYYI